ncbi:MAG: hypothetical protein HN742_32930 [Lentisphaerae bacterium]|jgi:aminoglycoside 3-N-acetyltransferase|nr:hypothetical protein [Lentisphaerota bacterium]MBT4817777.1 hypothetical protein [Lentisphaerota bacterium]MBT5610886.1 hypothetical protein [Lentisphaerota bacterium]MBT7060653.1 hypothetical protein [Lentisphaerota bacterium]MBT7846722.1 hypothetical protein [Lentisphaerota bacterium]
MDLNRLISILRDQTDDARIMALVSEIVNTDRWNSFDQFPKTTETILRAFSNQGLETESCRLQTGGRMGTGRWLIQEASEIQSATLRVVAPTQQPLADYHDNPWSAIQWGCSTPSAGLTCSVRVVDSWKELERIPQHGLRGTFVLTRLSPAGNHFRWANTGAAGLICDAPVKGCPDATCWGKFGWGGLPFGTSHSRLPGIMLSKNTGKALRALLRSDDGVRLHMNVRVRSGVGHHDVVSGILSGRADPQDEVWAIAHSCEPGAIDNASGISVCAEALQILSAAIQAGLVPAPLRSIRALAGFECYGFFEYLISQKRLQSPLAGVCVDCVGAKGELCDHTLTWHDTLPSAAGFVNTLGFDALNLAFSAEATGMTLKRAPFTSTEDTMIGDPRYGFPCPYLGSFPYRTYHSSADTPGLLDPRILRNCAVGVAAYLYQLANADSRQVQSFATRAAGEAISQVNEASDAATVMMAVQGFRANATRLPRWFWGGEHAELLNGMELHSNTIQQCAGDRLADISTDTSTPSADQRIPFRRVPLAPTYENVPPDIRERFKEAGVHKWTLYWADGTRTLGDIHQLACAERGKDYRLSQVVAFFEAMAEIGYIDLPPSADVFCRQDLVADLRELGVGPGMDLMVHSSLSAIGCVRGGADSVVDALLEAIGPQGTLLMPSFNHKAADVYNPLTTPTTNGAIADAMWRRSEAARSNHPTHAVAAIGPKAEPWCADHIRIGVWSADSPIGQLIHSGGYILALGVDHRSSTAYHVAEISMNAPCLEQFTLQRPVVDAAGAVKNVSCMRWRDGVCPVSPGLLNSALDEAQLQQRGKIGNATSALVKATDLWAMRRKHLQDACPTCTVRPDRTW